MHLNLLVGVILCSKRTLFERGLPYTFKSPNKQLNHRFLHFVISLKSKFYTLAPTVVFDVNICCSMSLYRQPATIIEFSVVFAVALASRYSF